MEQMQTAQEERKVSRSEKILEAKSAFLPGAQTNDAGRNCNRYAERKKHSFGLLRMLLAGVLFLVLVFAFQFNISYQGFNKESVKELLADNSRWESLVNQVSAVMKQIE